MGGVAGFLRDVDSERGLGLVDLDGDTVRITPDVVSVPHPVLLDDLDDLREFAVELGVSQNVEQLFREVWRRPPGLAPETTSVDTYAGWRVQGTALPARPRHAARVPVARGYAVCPVVEDGATAEARIWIGEHDGYDAYDTETGPLGWTDPSGRALTAAEVGPVAWSEGMRMAAALYAGRDVEDEERAA